MIVMKHLISQSAGRENTETRRRELLMDPSALTKLR